MAQQNEDDPRPSADEIAAAMQELSENQRILDYDTKDFTVEVLLHQFGNGVDDDIYVPDYQRKFNWDKRRQSRFIESLLIGLPIPFLFFGEVDDGRFEVVDGCQRLNTCKAFYQDALVLRGLERVTKMNGFRFSDLPIGEQRRFRKRTIRSVALSGKASEDDRRDLFDRINTGSLIPEDVEIRRGAIKGVMTDLIDELAKDPSFLALCPMTETDRRKRTGEELVTRFFAYGDGLNGYRDQVRTFLTKWLKDVTRQADDDHDIPTVYRKRFTDVMSFVAAYFPHGFAKKPGAATTPRVRFDSIAVGAYWAMREQPRLLASGPAIAPTEWLSSDDFFLITTSNAANVRSRIFRRIEFVQYMLLGDADEARRRAGLLEESDE